MNHFENLQSIYFIAEIGVNHNGDMHLAKKMIDEAKKAGANAVKFQTFTAENLVSPETPKVNYQISTTSPNQSHYDMIKYLELSKENHFILNDYCQKCEIDFLSTPYDPESARFLQKELKVKYFKTASADLIDSQLHHYIASSGIPVIISVGMASLGEIESTLRIYSEHDHSDIILLHCVSNYPCSDESLNFRSLETIQKAFQLPIGYSDHSIGTEAAILSVAFGAKIVEKHFTIDKNLDGPDQRASSTPAEFTNLVNSVKRAEIMLGSPIKSCAKEEKQMRKVSRKSLFFKKSLKKGTIIKSEHLSLKRPGSGIPANEINSILGKSVCVDTNDGQQIKYSHFD